jgi:hypothetical protein
MKQYANRDPMKLDAAGNYYIRHVGAMTSEGLHAKSDIAAELAWRDMQIDRLAQALVDVMDGVSDHHIQDRTALPESDCDRIAEVRTFAINHLKQGHEQWKK